MAIMRNQDPKRRFSATAIAVLIAAGTSIFSQAAGAGPTLDAIRKRGHLICGVDTSLLGFSIADAKGHWTGLDVDICRAVAAALFGTPDKARFVPVRTVARFDVLKSGAIDILSRNTTWTLTRDAALGISFTATVFYDGQGFIVPRRLFARSVRELGGVSVCVQPGTTTELNLADYFQAHNMTFRPVVYENIEEVAAAFFSGRCEAMTTDASKLAVLRETRAPKGESDNYVILPEVISKEPLAPAVRKGDEAWADIVKWTVFALIEAEEHGLTQANAERLARESKNPNIRRFLGATPGVGKAIGLTESWVLDVVKGVGNYGEIWTRSFGLLGLPRGLNRLWSKGGIMYAPPLR
jgi:general L-amino acid transport system substrate-binding protein